MRYGDRPASGGETVPASFQSSVRERSDVGVAVYWNNTEMAVEDEENA